MFQCADFDEFERHFDAIHYAAQLYSLATLPNDVDNCDRVDPIRVVPWITGVCACYRFYNEMHRFQGRHVFEFCEEVAVVLSIAITIANMRIGAMVD